MQFTTWSVKNAYIHDYIQSIWHKTGKLPKQKQKQEQKQKRL